MQDHPGAPGTARQESTHITVSTYDGGNATQPRAPGHERPHAALCAARHGRLSAASTAPGADVPRATSARAPGQYCQSAAPRAPGHGRPLDITAGVSGHDRLSAAPIATVTSPAGPHRLRQGILPRTPATPNTLTHRDTTHIRTTRSHCLNCHSHESMSRTPIWGGNPRPPVATGGPQGGYAPATCPTTGRRADSPSLPGKGPGDRSKPHHTWHYPCGFGLSAVRSTFHQVHPAIQVPPHPRSCSTAAAGGLHQHPSRAPPAP